MTRYADPGRCPDCAHPIEYADPACPGCGLPLRGLTAQRLYQTLSQADALLLSLRAEATPAHVALRSKLVGAGVGATREASAAAAGTGLEAVGLATRAGAADDPWDGPATTGPGAASPRLSAASVPKILLGLGAACLLIAALVFLAVTWSVMGVGGRTATLLGFTAATAVLAAWMARRDLRGAAEALSLVSLGLLTLDAFGARSADWFGDISTPWFLALLGILLATAGTAAALAARRTAAATLVGVEIVAGVGLGVAASGLAVADGLTRFGALVVAVLLPAAAAVAVHRVGLRFATPLASAASGLAWLGLLGYSLDTATPATLHGLWVELDGARLLVCAALVAAPALLRALPVAARVAFAAAGFAVLALTVALPALDESATAAVLAGLGVLLAAGAVAWLAPRPWGLVGSLAQAGAGLAGLAATAAIGVTALDRSEHAASLAWAGSTGGRLAGTLPADLPAPWLAPLCLLALFGTGLTLAKASSTADRVVSAVTDLRVAAGLLAAACVATLACYPVPVWTVLLALVVVAGGLTAWWLVRPSLPTLAIAAAFLAAAVALAAYDEWLTAAALGATLLLTGCVHLRARQVETSAVAGAAAVAALAGSVWTWGALLDADGSWVALVGLGLLAAVALTLSLYPDDWWSCEAPQVGRAGVEVGTAMAALPLGLLGVLLAPADLQATWTAVYLTVAGAAVTALSVLRPDRRALAWAGGALLALASWVRLWDIGVHEPEPYTLPSAAALLAVGFWHLRRRPEAGTTSALGAGLGLALVPSLLWVLADPTGPRALLLGLGCLALVVGGVQLRWTAPLLAGAVVGALEAVRLAAPYVGDAVPRWVLIGAAGALLIVMGVTWERRLKEARAVLGYVRALR